MARVVCACHPRIVYLLFSLYIIQTPPFEVISFLEDVFSNSHTREIYDRKIKEFVVRNIFAVSRVHIFKHFFYIGLMRISHS